MKPHRGECPVFLGQVRPLFFLVLAASHCLDSSRCDIDRRCYDCSANLNGCYCNSYNCIRNSDDSATGAQKWKQRGKKYCAHH